MFETVIHPRVSETDAVGHINNTVIPVWLEAGRGDFFRIFGPDDDFSQWRMIVVNISVDYVKEIHYPNAVVVRTYVERIGTSSILLLEEIYQNDQLCCRGHTTYVNVDPANARSQPLTPEFRAALEEHLYTPAKDEE